MVESLAEKLTRERVEAQSGVPAHMSGITDRHIILLAEEIDRLRAELEALRGSAS